MQRKQRRQTVGTGAWWERAIGGGATALVGLWLLLFGPASRVAGLVGRTVIVSGGAAVLTGVTGVDARRRHGHGGPLCGRP